jgi:hypothetical protein
MAVEKRFMHSLSLALCLLAAMPSWAAEQEAAATPFWLLPKAELDLRALAPADVKLVATPDRSRELALLQVGDTDLKNYFAAVDSNPDTGYRVLARGLQVGALPYGDRRFRIEQLPEAFVGLTLLQTTMQHKPILDGRFGVVLATAKPCWVFVAIEEDVLQTYKQHGVPSWLQEFAPTGQQLVTNHPRRGNCRVFVKQAPAGRIVLGPPCMEAYANSMYFAFFAEAK